MSSMIPTPPRSIQIGGPSGGGPGGPSSPGGGSDGPDSQKVRDLVNQAVGLLRQAEDLEGDAQDQALLANAVAQLRKFVGAQQQMEDALMGGGPAAKVMRKNPSAPSGPSGGGY